MAEAKTENKVPTVEEQLAQANAQIQALANAYNDLKIVNDSLMLQVKVLKAQQNNG